MKTLSISQITMIFEFLVQTMLDIPNFIDPAELFQKLWGLLLKVPLCDNMTDKSDVTLVRVSPRGTSKYWKSKNSNINNFWNNENFDLLFFANIHHFWWSIRFKQNIYRLCFHDSSPLSFRKVWGDWSSLL